MKHHRSQPTNTVDQLSPRTAASQAKATERPQSRNEIAIPIYEKLLDHNSRWALSEGSLFFEGEGAVQKALYKITRRLADLNIPYAIVGGMALYKHGLRRFTEDVDLLVTRENLKIIHEKLDGLGYLPPFKHSKHLRDTELGVKVEFLVTGEFPGDGKPKPVAFPDPVSVSFEDDGIRYITLPTLIELKLASGMTNLNRMKDLTDVLELIKQLNLPHDFRDRLNPFVRDKFTELWKSSRRRYVRVWRNKFLTIDANSINDMIDHLKKATEELEAMRADGVTLEPDGGTADDYAYLVTTDPEIAQKYEMLEETEYWKEEA